MCRVSASETVTTVGMGGNAEFSNQRRDGDYSCPDNDDISYVEAATLNLWQPRYMLPISVLQPW